MTKERGEVNERGAAVARGWSETRVGFLFLVLGVVMQGVALIGEMGAFDSSTLMVVGLFLLGIPLVLAVAAYTKLVPRLQDRLWPPYT